MNGLTGSKLSGWLLIAGTLLFMAGTMVKPGYPTTPTWEQIAGATGLTHVGAQLAILGLLLLVFGLATFWRPHDQDGWGDTVVRCGIVAVIIAEAGWLYAEGINHSIAHFAAGHDGTAGDLTAGGNALERARLGFQIIAGNTTVLGTAILAFGLWTRFSGGFYKPLALATALVLAPGFIVQLLASHLHSPILVFIALALTLPVALFYLLLGAGLARSGREFAA